jgi:glycyl-tRNA synthetase
MFKTEFGAVAADNPDDNIVYLRPETAQGIFVNFLNVQKTARMRVPFGIAQTGKAFRNEIVARQFIFRMRNLNKWKCSSLCAPAQKATGINTGNRKDLIGI